MNAKHIMELVEHLDRSSALMLRWIKAGPRDRAASEVIAYDCAVLAGHYANRLLDLAELGKAA